MNNQIFRKKSMERISSPEQLEDYIKVSNPGIFMILAAVIVLLAGACVWGIFGRLDTTISTVMVHQGGQAICYVREADAASVEAGMTVRIKDDEYPVMEVSKSPKAASETLNDYSLHMGGFQSGEWVCQVRIDCDLPEGVYEADIVTDSVSAMTFVFN